MRKKSQIFVLIGFECFESTNTCRSDLCVRFGVNQMKKSITMDSKHKITVDESREFLYVSVLILIRSELF
jgi:hypothetical protein